MRVDAKILMSKLMLKGMTQADVAKAIGITPNAYSNKLHNRTCFTDDEKIVLAKLFQMNLSEFNDAFYEGMLPVGRITMPIINVEGVIENGT